jgi:hypothetical protein
MRNDGAYGVLAEELPSFREEIGDLGRTGAGGASSLWHVPKVC